MNTAGPAIADRDSPVEIQRATTDPGVPDDESLSGWASAVLALAPAGAEVVIRLVDADEGRALNHRYRGRDYATNVLSFPFEAPPGLEFPLLGDLAICAPVVAREAAEQGKALEAHWAHMVVHGMLHLLGHDHQRAAEARRMEALERELLAAMGYPDPYRMED